MAILYDARGNEIRSSFPDTVTNEAVTDARPITATLSALNAEVVMDLNGAATALFDLRTAAMNATLVFEGTVDGTNYIGLPGFDIQTEAYLSAVVVTAALAKTYTVGVTGLRRIRCRVSAFTSGTMVVAARASRADLIIYAKPMPSQLSVQVDGAANANAVLTLPAPGAGMFHYITSISWYRHCTAALVGTGAFSITSTNLGALRWRIGNAIAVGENKIDVSFVPGTPLKSAVANTASTITASAAGAAVLTTGYCTYYVGA
jgi:hypothetical protein